MTLRSFPRTATVPPSERRLPALVGRVLGADRPRQLIRYGTVSVIATLTSLTVLGVLVATATLAAAPANVVATAVGTVPSFELNRRWVWGRTGRRSVGREVGPFVALSFAGLGLSTAAVGLAAGWAEGAGLGPWPVALVAQADNVVAFGSLWVAQFVILDRVLFRRRRTPAPPSVSPSATPRAEGSPVAGSPVAGGERSLPPVARGTTAAAASGAR